MNVITGTFNRMNHAVLSTGLLTPPVGAGGALVLNAGWTYARIQVHPMMRNEVKWGIAMGVLAFGGVPGGRCVQFASGGAAPGADSRGLIEIAIPTLGTGFALTDERRKTVQDRDEFVVNARYELRLDETLVAVHFVDFVYTLIKEVAPHVVPSPKSTGPGAVDELHRHPVTDDAGR